MPWVYLDDGFPDHHKVEAAGGDAAWLFVCGLCFANKNLTGGRILKRKIAGLSDRKSPQKLAQKLVEVGMWIDDGDAYLIHDYDVWNHGAAERSAKGKKAAQARWDRVREASAEQSQEACSEHAPSIATSTATSNALRAPGRWDGDREIYEVEERQPPSLALVVIDSEPDPFADFWTRYPRKVGKPTAEKAWAKIKTTNHQAVMAGLETWAAHWVATGKTAEFIPHPSTFLNDCRWKDRPAATKADTTAEIIRATRRAMGRTS